MINDSLRLALDAAKRIERARTASQRRNLALIALKHFVRYVTESRRAARERSAS